MIGVGNYLLATPSELGNCKIVDNHRPGMPCSHIAALPGARHSTITPAVQAITNLPGSGHPALAPGPVRVRTPTDLRRHAAAAGITIPDPPPRGRLRK